MVLLILNTILCFLNTWQFHLLNWQGVGPMLAISISFVYTRLLAWAFLQSHKLNLTYCLKCCLLLEFFFRMDDQTQMHPSSSTSLLGLFQRITYDIVRTPSFLWEGWDF